MMTTVDLGGLCLGILCIMVATQPSVLEGHYDYASSRSSSHHSRHSSHQGHHGAELDEESCPSGWTGKPFLCYDLSRKEYDFAEALAYCLNQQSWDQWNGGFYGLISVGQLRHFRNRYPYAPEVERGHHHFHEQRLFRVNARKTKPGKVWHEYISGKEVQFHHYPGFDPSAGHPGDTLIWDSKTDKLYTADPRETYHVLCSTRKSDSCKDCPDAQWENECNNAGDCLDGKCFCDVGFEGHKCQVEPFEDADVDLVLYTGASETPSLKVDLETNTSCAFAGFPAQVENAVTGQAFGHPISCGGNSIGGSAINQCWIYRHQTWLPEVDMSVPRSNAAATVINDGRHDLIYWVTFGQDELGNDLSSSEYLPWFGDHWKSGPSLGPDYARQSHCAVQINDCEAAVLGGLSNDTTYRDDILIFNFEDAKWKEGPRLRVDRAELACAVIKDSQSDHPLVISACGLDENGFSDVVEKWDLTTWDTQILDYTCPLVDDTFDSAWAVSDREILFTSGSEIYSFTLDYGFRKIDDWANSKVGSGSALIKKNYVDCA